MGQDQHIDVGISPSIARDHSSVRLTGVTFRFPRGKYRLSLCTQPSSSRTPAPLINLKPAGYKASTVCRHPCQADFCRAVGLLCKVAAQGSCAFEHANGTSIRKVSMSSNYCAIHRSNLAICLSHTPASAYARRVGVVAQRRQVLASSLGGWLSKPTSFIVIGQPTFDVPLNLVLWAACRIPRGHLLPTEWQLPLAAEHSKF